MDDDTERFAGTAQFYAEYRPDYGEDVIEHLAEHFGVGPDSRVLDLGCGTGQIALPLAAHAERVVGMDPNPAMLRQARQRAEAAGVETVEWQQGSDEDLPAIDGPLRLTTIGRAFHWMDQERTLEGLRVLTEPDGGVALVDDTNWFTQGRAAWQDAVYELTGQYLDGLPARARPGEIEYEEP